MSRIEAELALERVAEALGVPETEAGDRQLVAWIESPDWSLVGHLDPREALDLAEARGFLLAVADAPVELERPRWPL